MVAALGSLPCSGAFRPYHGPVLAPHPVAPTVGGSWPSCCALSSLLVAVRKRPGHLLAEAKSSRTELLVDGDVNSLSDMQKAIELLEKQNRKVKTTIFGPPGARRSSREFKQFLQGRNVVFQPVERGQDARSEANDEAIQCAIESLARNKRVRCVALLSSDKGFLSSLQDCMMRGTQAVLFVQETKFEAIRFYKANRVPVQSLPTERNSTRIRAVLHADGSGDVKMAAPYTAFDNETQATAVMGFLQDLGCYNHEEGMYLIQSVAKLWFANKLGRLTVFPSQLATIAMSSAIASNSLLPPSRPLAFFLPVSGVGMGKAEQFGSRLARSMFKGGGPFMLKDSAALTRTALTKLGYMDDDLNADLTEAMFIFVNLTGNKHFLRKLGMLPSEQASAQEIDDMLRQAFLSNKTCAQWRVGPRCSKQVQQILVAAGLLPTGRVSEDELLDAMSAYLLRHGLPEMQTFNGKAWRIMRFNNTNPCKREVLEIART